MCLWVCMRFENESTYLSVSALAFSFSLCFCLVERIRLFYPGRRVLKLERRGGVGRQGLELESSTSTSTRGGSGTRRSWRVQR